eukprot:TRINITY_DN6496_c0_g1_i4.p1 TRINITY_DN6496_c0_g1~~TRINITY_DN6496_c0_g1_i4.p1  ORF type:complete len:603 (-),score=110.71 TRINITY_DN6496_c0_g1_i4:80-1867(-)
MAFFDLAMAVMAPTISGAQSEAPVVGSANGFVGGDDGTLAPATFLCELCHEPIGTVCSYLCSCQRHALHADGQCLDQWVSSQWGLESGGGFAIGSRWGKLRGCPTCPGARQLSSSEITNGILPKLSRDLLQRAADAAVRASEGNCAVGEAEEDSVVRRIADELQEAAVLRCPSCHTGFVPDPDRGCDAVWCQNEACRRAFCLYCLSDCGDDTSTDGRVMQNSLLVGDAHDHVKNDDCGLTGGRLFSGEAVVAHHAERIRRERAVRLRRVRPAVRQRVCELLGLTEADVSEKCGLNISRGAPTSSKPEENKVFLQVSSGFLNAAFNGDHDRVLALLQSRIDPCIEDVSKSGLTGLDFAALRGHTDIVQTLLEYRAMPDHSDAQGMTALHHLGNVNGCGSVDVARLLVVASLRVVRPGIYLFVADVKMNGGASVEHFVGWHNHNEMALYLRRMRGDGRLLLDACAAGNVSVVQEILEKSSIAQDLVHMRLEGNGVACLHAACSCDDAASAAATVSVLLDFKADANVREPYCGRAPLHCLAVSGSCSVEVARRLVERGGADVLARDWAAGQTPIEAAVDRDGSAAFRAYLESFVTVRA